MKSTLSLYTVSGVNRRGWSSRRLAGSVGAVLTLAMVLLTGCEGEGTGQVEGSLFVRGCKPLDPTMRSEDAVPSPLPSYQMNPSFFSAEIEQSVRWGRLVDLRGYDRMRIRLQNSSRRVEISDGLELFIYDLDRLPQLQAAAMARGERGMPIVPPPVDQSSVPLPGDPQDSVRAALNLYTTCKYPISAPQLRGYVYFSKLGNKLGDVIAGEFAVTVEDLRARREEGQTVALSPDVAGQLSGYFSFPLRTGPASTGP